VDADRLSTVIAEHVLKAIEFPLLQFEQRYRAEHAPNNSGFAPWQKQAALLQFDIRVKEAVDKEAFRLAVEFLRQPAKTQQPASTPSRLERLFPAPVPAEA
jgi:hypothetical protein